MSSTRVVITGLGIISPIGMEPDTLWNNLVEGRSGIAPLQNLPSDGLPFRSAAEVSEFTGNIEDYGPLDKTLQRAIKKGIKVMCREIEMGVAAAQRALAHSGLGQDRDPDRCGCLFGCDYILTRPEEYSAGLVNCRRSIQALVAQSVTGQSAESETDSPDELASCVAKWPSSGLPKVNPLWLLKYLPNMPNSHVSIYNDLRGPSNAITVRETSMHLSLSEATSIIRRGAADVMLVGATGSRLHPLRTPQVILSEDIASEQPDPTTMSRPFDISSDGTVLGEGAGAVMLETLEHAQARGAKIWGEIVGTGAAMSGSSHDRNSLRRSIAGALCAAAQRAGDALRKSWHLHAQGLSAPAQDAAEAAAIADLFNSLGYNVPVVAAKSYFGNLGSGGAAVELVCSLLAMDRGQLFPIRNLNKLIPEATWKTGQLGEPAGTGFVHSSFTLQGQSAAVAISALQ